MTTTSEILQKARYEWQPIETAPKDGTEFLGYDGTNMDVTRWESLQLMSWSAEHGEYLMQYGFVAKYSEWRPTHWMPLPAPPAIKRAISAEVAV